MRALVVLVALVTMPAIARADDREEAAREFSKGQAADKRRDYTAAIEHYKRANELLPHPYAIYNIAVDYERLGQFRNSATWFDAYLDAAPSANDRDKVNRKILDLRNKPAKIIVRSFPTGATVKIQGLPAGSTPLTTEREGGIYRVVIEKDGDRDARDITIEYGEPVEIDVQLRDNPNQPPGRGPDPNPNPSKTDPRPSPGARVLRGVLRIEGIRGAFVSVNNEPAGSVPLRVPLEQGQHRITVRSQGYQTFDSWIMVAPDRETTIDTRMPHALGGKPPVIEEPKPKYVHWLVGGGGGIDARARNDDGSAAPVVLGEVGLRASRYDATTRLGSINGQFAFDIALRYSLFDAKVSPFAGFGYSYAYGGLGWELVGGIRVDIKKTEKWGMSLVTEVQARWYTTSTDTAASDMQAGVLVPIVASLQVLYR